MFLTQPVLREVHLRNLSRRSNAKFMGHNIAFQAVEDVEGIKMGQLPVTVITALINHSLNSGGIGIGLRLS